MLSSTIATAGSLRLTALFVCSIAVCFASLAHAQPHGGQLLQAWDPYQLGSTNCAPEFCLPDNRSSELDAAPIYLDTCQEFTLQDNTYSGEPVLIQPAEPEPASQLPPGTRNGVFQKLFFTGTYLPRLESDSLGFSELDTGIVLAVPFFRVTAPLVITPHYAVHYLDGPNAPDLPARVHDADITFRHLRKFGNGPWAMNAAVTLGYYSDYQQSDPDAFRVTGQAFAVYESSPATQWIFGVVYLNRDDFPVIPAVGFIHQPNPHVKYEAILPKPRILWRLPGDAISSRSQRWAYLAGELSSGVWSIQRPATTAMPATFQDLVTYTDYRILLGIERKNFGGISHHLEAGYVFARKLQFATATPDTKLDDSLFVRLGFSY